MDDLKMLPGYWMVLNGKVQRANIMCIHDKKLYRMVEASSLALLPSSSNKPREWTEREIQQWKEIKYLKRLVKEYKKVIDIQVDEHMEMVEKLKKCRNNEK